LSVDLFNNNTMRLLEGGIYTLGERHRVLSNNIANVNTPNFKRSDVDFMKSLEAAMNKGGVPLRTTSEKHLGAPVNRNGVVVYQDNTTTMRPDGNNVDIDVEMAEMAKNSLHYEALVRQLSEKYSLIGYVLREAK